MSRRLIVGISASLLGLTLQACCGDNGRTASLGDMQTQVAAEQPAVRQVTMAEITAAIEAQDQVAMTMMTPGVTQPGCQKNFDERVAAVADVLHSYHRM